MPGFCKRSGAGQQGLDNNADAAQQEEHDGQPLQGVALDPPDDGLCGAQGQHGGDHGDDGELEAGGVQQAGGGVQDDAEQVLTPEQKADAALEFVVILGGPLEVGHQEQIDAEQAGAHAGEEDHQIADGRVVLPAGADGTQVPGSHFQAQEQHHDAQHRFDDPGHGEPQQPGAGNHTGQQNDQQGQDLPQVQQLPALPGNIGVDAEIRHQAAGGDESVVQTHGQQGRGGQWVAEADDPFDDVAEKLEQENKQRNVPCEFHRCASCAEYVDRREKIDK